METVEASIMWDGPERNILCVFREPTPLWEADPSEQSDDVYILLALDDEEQETGEVAGIEILDFLSFADWDALPELPVLWKVGNTPALPLAELLRNVQAELRKQAKAGAA